MMNLIEKTQSTGLSFVPQTTKLTLTQHFRTANNTIHQTQMRLRRRHWIIVTGAQQSKLYKTYAVKQLLSTREYSYNFPACHTTLRLLAAFDTT